MLESRVIKNSITQLFTRAFELGSIAVLTVAVGRLEGAGSLGEFAIAVTFANLFLFAADWGLGMLLVREVARHKDRVDEYVRTSLAWAAMCSVVSIGLIVLLGRVFGYTSEVRAGIAWGGLWMGVGALSLTFRGAFHAFERMEFETAAVFVERSVATVGGLWIATHGGHLPSLMMVLVVSRLLGLVVNFALYSRFIGRVRLGVNWALAKHLVPAAIPFGINAIATAVYIHSDAIVLSYFRNTTEVGFYRAGGALVIPLATVVVVFNNALLPNLSRMFSKGDHEALVRLFRQSCRIALTISVPLAVVMAAMADKVLVLLFGRPFLAAVPVLQILALIIPLRFVCNSLGTGLTAIDQQQLRTKAALAAAGLNIVMNIVILPIYGMVGAGVTTVVTDVILVAITYWYVQRHVLSGSMARIVLGPVISGLAMGAVLVFLSSWPVIPLLAAGLVCYTLLLKLTGGLPTEDLMRIAAGVRMAPQEMLRTWSKDEGRAEGSPEGDADGEAASLEEPDHEIEEYPLEKIIGHGVLNTRRARRILKDEGAITLAWQLLMYAARPIKFLYESLAWWLIRKKAGNGAVSVGVFGHELLLHRDDPGISKELAVHRVHEPVTTRLLLDSVHEGMTIIDVGSNIGYFALLEARVVGPKGRVIAIEPAPENAQLLARNLEANGYRDVAIRRAAVSNEDGHARLYRAERSNWHSLVASHFHEDDWFDVETHKLDTVIAECGLASVDLVRMDIEGYETVAVQGMLHTIDHYKPDLLVELHPHLTGAEAMVGMLQLLQTAGYKVVYVVDRYRDIPWVAWRLTPEKLSLAELIDDPRVTKLQQALTVLFARKSDRERSREEGGAGVLRPEVVAGATTQ